MMLREGLVGSNVCALCRVQLIAWGRNANTGCLTVHYWEKLQISTGEAEYITFADQ